MKYLPYFCILDNQQVKYLFTLKLRLTIMKKWKCTVCGYVHEGENPPEECPLCGVGPEDFEEVVE